MLMILVVLSVLGGYALYSMKPEERIQLKERLVIAATRARSEAERRRAEPEPFRDALRERTPWPAVMPALVALNVVLFVLSASAGSAPEALISWGASFGPRTSNGEWWRLAASMFVHVGLFQLIVNCAALVQLGLILERLVGHVTFAAVFFAAGVFASIVSLSDYPMLVSSGASGGIFGLYGLLLASSAWSTLRRAPSKATEVEPVSSGTFGLRDLPQSAPVELEAQDDPLAEAAAAPRGVAMTLTAARRLAPIAGFFLLFNLLNGNLGFGAEIGGLAVGFICGVVLTYGVSIRTPPVPRVAVTMAATVMVAVASAVPLRGVADVRPEVSRVIAVEESTTTAYKAAVKQFQLGTVSAEALAQMIDRKITPELQTVQARFKDLGRVPPEHQQLLEFTLQYLRLREESWRLRAAALHKSSGAALRTADAAERASLMAFDVIKPVDAPAASPAAAADAGDKK
jgi:membrane associated rhomboid family serine protease